MGQYFLIANLDKKEYLLPWRLSHGCKLWEICANSISGILPFLLRKSNEGGGGDIRKEYASAGRWAGDRIVVIGDYDESKLWDEARSNFREISEEIVEEFNDFIEIPEMQQKLDSSVEK